MLDASIVLLSVVPTSTFIVAYLKRLRDVIRPIRHSQVLVYVLALRAKAIELVVFSGLMWTVGDSLGSLAAGGAWGRWLCVAMAVSLGLTKFLPSSLASGLVYEFVSPHHALLRYWVLPITMAQLVMLARLAWRAHEIAKSARSLYQRVTEIAEADESPQGEQRWLAGPSCRHQLVRAGSFLTGLAPITAVFLLRHPVSLVLVTAAGAAGLARCIRTWTLIRNLTRSTQWMFLRLLTGIDVVLWVLAASPFGRDVAHGWSRTRLFNAGGGTLGLGFPLLVLAGTIAIQQLMRDRIRSHPVLRPLVFATAFIRQALNIEVLPVFLILAIGVFHPQHGPDLLISTCAAVLLVRAFIFALLSGGYYLVLDCLSFFDLGQAYREIGLSQGLMDRIILEPGSRRDAFIEIFDNRLLAVRNERIVGGWIKDCVLARRRPNLLLVRRFSSRALGAATGRYSTVSAYADVVAPGQLSAVPQSISTAGQWLACGELLLSHALAQGEKRLRGRRAERLRRAAQDEILFADNMKGLIYQYREMYDEALVVWLDAYDRCSEWRPQFASCFRYNALTLLMVMGRGAEAAWLSEQWADTPGVPRAEQKRLLAAGAMGACVAGDLAGALSRGTVSRDRIGLGFDRLHHSLEPVPQHQATGGLHSRV